MTHDTRTLLVDSHVPISVQYSMFNAFELYTNTFITINKNATTASIRRPAIILHTQVSCAPQQSVIEWVAFQHCFTT